MLATPERTGRRGKKKTSFVWKHFRVSEIDERRAVCNKCGAAINRGKNSRNYCTSSLASHLKSCLGEGGVRKTGKTPRKSAPPDVNILFDNDSETTDCNGVSLPLSVRSRLAPGEEFNSSEMSDTGPSEEYIPPEPYLTSIQDIVCGKQVDLVHSGFMMHSLYQQHRCGKFCDMTLISAQEEDSPALVSQSTIMVASRPTTRKIFKAHTSVLAGLSKKVKALIEMGSRTIELKDVSPFGLESLLEIIYTGKLRPGLNLRYYEVHQIWKAASDLGVEYVQNYIMREHPQISKWIQDEQKKAAAEEAAQYMEERLAGPQESDDLVDMCGAVSVVENEEVESGEASSVKIEDIHGRTTPVEFHPSEDEETADDQKKDDSTFYEITFPKS